MMLRKTKFGIRGFTLVEMMIVVAIISILASLAVPMYRRMIATADAMVAAADIKEVAQAIDLYYLTYGHYPDSLADVGKDKVLDPWGRPYQYLRLDNLTEEEEEEVEDVPEPEPEPVPVAAASNSNGNGNGGRGGKGNSGNGNSGNGNSGGNSGNGNSGGSSGNDNGGGSNGNGSSGGSNGGNKNVRGARKDKNLHPINTDYDLYSLGPDGESALPLTAKASHDDIIRANNGGFFGVASTY